MRASLFSWNKRDNRANNSHNFSFLFDTRQRLISLCVLLFLLSMIVLSFGKPILPVSAAFDHTQATLDMSCTHVTFTKDGNPFPLCPGTAPGGGNCVWWGWEQWHLLGYNLPVDWGNAADWIVDAERFGLPVGTTPRVGALAVFPVADGTWAFGKAGHLAFVTSVSPNGSTFNVTYQNYGDPTFMHTGHGYNVSYINQPRYQNGHLRFLYFPKQIDPQLFAKLPGVNGTDLSGVNLANEQQNVGILADNQVALGLPPGSSDQEFDADFTGNGTTNLLLYNRPQGRLDVLALSYADVQYNSRLLRQEVLEDPSLLKEPYRVSLSDAHTSETGWGQNLDIHLGDFTGSGHTEILLYDRVSGQIQLLTLNPNLTIATHVTLQGWGAGWELYTGRFDGQKSDLLLYKRFAIPPPPPPTTPTPGPTATPPPTTPTPGTAVTPVPTPAPPIFPTGTPSSTPTGTAQTGSANSFVGQQSFSSVPLTSASQRSLATAGSGEPTDPNGQSPADWVGTGLTAEIRVVSFTKDFAVETTQDYTYWHNTWEIYVDPLVSGSRDGIFLYDRNAGEARVLEYSPQLQLTQFQFLHGLVGNWEVHTGDFIGQGQAQMLLYDPSSGAAQMLIFKSDFTVASQINYPNWGADMVLYVGHFGLPTLSIMLYNPQQAQSTFMAFDASAEVTHQYTVPSWGETSQILVGSFLDRSSCLALDTCTNGDDILVLDRSSGIVEQYVFAFANQFTVFDSRSQAFLRDGIATTEHVLPVDATMFRMVSLENGTIHNEELY